MLEGHSSEVDRWNAEIVLVTALCSIVPLGGPPRPPPFLAPPSPPWLARPASLQYYAPRGREVDGTLSRRSRQKEWGVQHVPDYCAFPGHSLPVREKGRCVS